MVYHLFLYIYEVLTTSYSYWDKLGKIKGKFHFLIKINNKEDLIQDFISIITTFCSRVYGQRRSKRKTEKIIEELNIKNWFYVKNIL